jgi:hypothetical protein
MASPIEAQIILCDAAQVDPLGKVHMLGAGWSLTSTPTGPSAVAVLLKVPWDRANQPLGVSLRLVTADGQPVEVEGYPMLGVEHKIEVGRPPGLSPGTPIDVAFQYTVPPLPLEPGRYQWRLIVADDEFSASFQVRLPPQGRSAT